MDNHLKTISKTADELRVGNYIVLYGGKDLEDEHFTKATKFDSMFTKTGVLYVDWEHRSGELKDEVLGLVDWKSARSDEHGLFVERVLDRRNQYVQWLEELICRPF